MSKDVDNKPGIAAADRVREKLAQAKERREEALDKAYDPDREFDPRDYDPTPTNPVIVIRKSDYPKSLKLRIPRNLKPYIIGGLIALALTGAGVQPEFLVSFAKSVFGVP